jgi:hypothetical protein
MARRYLFICNHCSAAVERDSEALPEGWLIVTTAGGTVDLCSPTCGAIHMGALKDTGLEYDFALGRVEARCIGLAQDLRWLMACAARNANATSDERALKCVASSAAALGPLLKDCPELNALLGVEVQR